MKKIQDEIEFYEQKLKDAKAKELKELSKKRKSIKVLNQKIADKYSIYHGDCVEVTKNIPSDSIHYSMFSPPFASLFTYSNSTNDMGNSTDEEFYKHFSYFIPELHRIIMPGRLVSIHCMDIAAMKERDGYIGLKDFPGIILRELEKVGFIYHSRVHIKKNELMEAQRTRAIGLAHKQVVKDSAISRNALPDYILTVRKGGSNPEPIHNPNGFERYAGEKEAPKKKKDDNHLKNRYSQKIWQRYASSVWFDIRQGNTLNVKQAREKEDERHVCPLQLDTIARCLELWTNENDVVFSPFMGIGSEGYMSLQMKRRFIGVELKESYYKVAKKNLYQSANKKIKGFFKR